MKRLPLFLLLLAALAAWLSSAPARAGVAVKGAPRLADVVLSEGFESEAWRLQWSVVDADGSGDSWGRLGADDFYEPRAGDWSLGCRFHEDGSANDDWLITPPMTADTTHRLFSIYYRSQDPAWPETVEFLSLHVEQALPAGSLPGHLEEFQLLERVVNAPVEWQQFQQQVDYATGGVWYFAVRCVSQDRFVLLVDEARGFWTVPLANWALETKYARLDFGLLQQDSTRRLSFRLWNLSETDTLVVAIRHRPWHVPPDSLSPFALHPDWEDDTLQVNPEDSLGTPVELQPVRSAGGDTTRFLGSFLDSLVLDLHQSTGGDTTWVIPITAAVWSPDSLGALALREDFEADGEPAGWELAVADAATDTLGWEFGSHVSSANFTVPARSRFAHLNSDARGRFTDGGAPMTQDAWLLSPWLDARLTAEGDTARGLLLAWDQVYDGRAAGLLQVLAFHGADTLGWQPRPSDGWESRSLDLSHFAGADSLRLAFRFTGSWSYGAALDEIVLLPVTDLLPGAAVPAPPRQPSQVEVMMAPNPFNPVTQVRYFSPEAGRLQVRVYNLLGQQVMERGPFLLRPGANAFPLDFGRLASGVYLVRLLATDTAGRQEQHLRRVTFLK